MKRPKRSNLNNILFSIFWWFIQRFSPKYGKKLLYWGLKSGAFPNRYKPDPVLGVDLMGFHFNTPIGIGAGFDNQGNVIDDLIFMGAGFGEFGPYTLERETPVTEVFFLRRDKAIVTQSLGYKNQGIINMIPVFTNRRYLPNIVSINITSTAEFEAENIKQGRVMTYAEEFGIMVRKVAPYTDMITLDFSHPETELSHILVDASSAIPLFKGVKLAAKEAAPIQNPRILVKIPLNLTAMELPLVCKNLLDSGVDGVVVAGPLSLSQNEVKLSKQLYAGMLEGMPIRRYVAEMIAKVYQFTKGNIPIIACGGVFSGIDAYDYIAAGASLVQIDTVLRFEGPNAITKINRELSILLQRKGLKSASQAVGIDFY